MIQVFHFAPILARLHAETSYLYDTHRRVLLLDFEGEGFKLTDQSGCFSQRGNSVPVGGGMMIEL